jgi:hypothetical protein
MDEQFQSACVMVVEREAANSWVLESLHHRWQRGQRTT